METVAEEKAASITSGPGSVGRRREVYYPINNAVQIEVLPGPSPRIGAWLMNLSRTGVRLRLKTIVEKNAHIKIQLRSDTAILGKVRCCRPGADGFDTSILIQDVTCSREAQSLHVDDDELLLYLVGKLLTVTDIIRLKSHLGLCESCRILLAKTNAILFAVRKRGGF